MNFSRSIKSTSITKRSIPLLTTLLIFTFTLGHSQIITTGLPVMKHFRKTDYRAGTQNWGISQDKQGFMYFANNNGLLRFDGNSWDLFPIPGNSLVRSVLCINDTIYVGAFEEFGYYTYSNGNDLTYTSLTQKIAGKAWGIDEVWRIYKYNNTILFQTFTYIMVLEKGEISAFPTPEVLQFSFLIGNDFFVQGKNGKIYKFLQNRFEPIDDGGKFAGKQIWAVLKQENGSTLLATINHGVWEYNNGTVKAWNNAANSYLIKNQIFTASTLRGGYIAFGTIQAGLVVTDEKGEIVLLIDKKRGLQNNTILSLYTDLHNNLWLGLDNGIDYMELNSPISIIDEGLGLFGSCYSTILYNNKLFVGTNQGLYVCDWPIRKNDIGGSFPFQRVEKTNGQVWCLEVIDGKLYCGHNFGTFEIDSKTNVEHTSTEEGSWTFLKLKNHPNKMLVGKYKGIHLYVKENGSWRFLKKVKGFDESCRFIAEDENENIWMAHGYKGVYRLVLNEEKDSVKYSYLFDNTKGFPVKTGINMEKLRNQIIFITHHGVFKYNALIDRMEPYSEFNRKLDDTINIRRLTEDSEGNIWILKSNDVKILKQQPDGKTSLEPTPLVLFGNSFVSSYENIYIPDISNVFLGTENGLIHYNPSYPTADSIKFKCYIKSMQTLSRKGEKIFTDYKINRTQPISIKYSNNSIGLTFTSPTYNAGEIAYSYKLEGYDTGWSEWSSNPIKEFTNLPYGNYTFRLKALDAKGRESDEVELKFTISNPWYLSLWAFIAYGITCVLITLILRAAVKAKIRNATTKVKEQKNLEMKVKEEEHKREVLEAEQEIIRLQNENLKVQVEHKNSELASIALQIAHKNEFLNQLKCKLEALTKNTNPALQKEVLELINKIDFDLRMDDEWKRFEFHFDEVHVGFLKRLKDLYPTLSPNELRLCAYLRLNMTTKDIAQILNISIRGVEISRYRLRKKLGIEGDTNLIDFMINL